METPGAVPMTEQAVWGVGSARKPRAPSQKPVLSGLAVASDPIGFWEGVGPDCAVATPLLLVTDNVGREKKNHQRYVNTRGTSKKKTPCFFWGGESCDAASESI